MLDKNDIANDGGINGTGIGLVNTNSKDYKGLQAAILAHAKQQTPEERIRYHLIDLKYQNAKLPYSKSTTKHKNCW